MQHSPADIIREIIISLGHGTDPDDNDAWPVFAHTEPNTPDNVITVFDTTPINHGRLQVTGGYQVHYGAQILLRATATTVGYPKMVAIRDALDISVNRDTIVIGAYSYLVHSIGRKTDILSIGKEVPVSSRELFTLNITAAITQNA